MFADLQKICKDILVGEPLCNHTAFRIGGKVRFLVRPGTSDELIGVLNLATTCGVPCFVMGNGSNLLVSDEGFDGICVQLLRNFSDITIDNLKITAKSGAMLATIASRAQASGLTGFEFAAGIPGTLGGAVVMNAGAYGGEMANCVVETSYIENGRIFTIADHDFSYRHSCFSGTDRVIVQSVIQLSQGDPAEILETIRALNVRRREKQPLDLPSAGSAFKRPPNNYAAKLIEDAGLKGFALGGAMVSEKHAGFIVNFNHATAADVKGLISHIQQVVEAQFGVRLEPEIKFV